MSFSIIARQVLMGLIAGSAFGSWAIVRPAPRADPARGSIGSSLDSRDDRYPCLALARTRLGLLLFI